MTLRFETLLNSSNSRIAYNFRDIESLINGYENNGGFRYKQREASNLRENAFWNGKTDTLNDQLSALNERINELSAQDADINLETIWSELGLEELWDGQGDETLSLLEGPPKKNRDALLDGPSEKEILTAITDFESEWREDNTQPFASAADVKAYYDEHYNALFEARAEIRAQHEQKMQSLANNTQLSAADEQALSEISQNVETHIARISTMMELVYNRQIPPRSYEDIPQDVKERMGEIFSSPLERVNQWNEDVANQGRFAHILSYTIQDFRNSPEGAQLEQMYRDFHEGGEPGKQLLIEQRMRELVSASIPDEIKDQVNEDMLYETMFEGALRPAVFNSFIDPKYDLQYRFRPAEPLDLTVESMQKFYPEGLYIDNLYLHVENGQFYLEGDNINIDGNTILIEGGNIKTTIDNLSIEAQAMTVEEDGRIRIEGNQLSILIPELAAVDPNGNFVMNGKNHSGKSDLTVSQDGEREHSVKRPWLDIEGNDSNTTTPPLNSFDDLLARTDSSDNSTSEKFHLGYYLNHQPNFRYFLENGAEDYFKTYLDAKGILLWYSPREEDGTRIDNPSKIDLTPEELEALNHFFVWHRDDPALTPYNNNNEQSPEITPVPDTVIIPEQAPQQ